MFKKRNIKKPETKRKVEALELDDGDDKPMIKNNTSKKIKKDDDIPTRPTPTRDIAYPKNTELEKPTNTAVVDINAPSDEIQPSKPPSLKALKPLAANIRTTKVMDFQPDVCKDFQQTGYCGYGDTCKFLHIRDETRAKKPVNREWETVGTKKEKASPIPFKCVLCKEDYKVPIKTGCGHVFCQKCFTTRFKSEKKALCFICGQDTGGIFHPILKSELDRLINGS